MTVLEIVGDVIRLIRIDDGVDMVVCEIVPLSILGEVFIYFLLWGTWPRRVCFIAARKERYRILVVDL